MNKSTPARTTGRWWNAARAALVTATLCVTALLQAQTFTVIGTGTASNGSGFDYPAPFGNYFWGARHQFFITAGELTAAGVAPGASISSLGLNVTATNGAAVHENWYMSVRTTAATDPIAAGWLTATPIAQTAVTNHAPVLGWNQFDLLSAFAWNGTDNLVIETCFQNFAWDVSASTQRTNTLAGATFSRWYHTDATGVCVSTALSGTSNTTRPNIRFGWTSGSACAGTPDPGNTLSSTSSACSGADFTLTLQNSTSGSGVNYAWESAPNIGGPWGPAGGPNAPSFITNLSSSTWYRCMVTCTNSNQSTTSNPVQVTLNTDPCQCLGYPASFATQTVDTDITGVTIGSFSNLAGCAVGTGPGSVLGSYSNWTTLAGPTMDQGETVNFSVTVDQCPTFINGYSSRFSVFVDWNQDGDFDDPGERVYDSPIQPSPYTLSNTFTVPMIATPGSTRLRVVCDEFSFNPAVPAGPYSYGETEDYCITINVPEPCTGTPAPGNTLSTTTNTCPSANFTLSLQNNTPGSGVTRQWQSADDAGFTVNLTNLGTDPTQITSQTSAKYYRCQVTCTISGQSTFSTPVLVNMGSNCFCGTYCSAGGFGSACITNVTLNTLNNSTLGCAGADPNFYSFQPGSTTLQVGASYNLQVSTEAGTDCSAWFDWNNDGFFTADEYFDVFSNGSTGIVNVTVPGASFVGEIRLRVRTRLAGFGITANDGCTFLGSGETEDYCITITPPPPCAGTPAPGATTASAAAACTGADFTLSISNTLQGTGTNYVWQSGPSAGGPWTDFGGNSSTQLANQSAATWYQCVVTCTNSGQSTTSTPVQVLQAGNCECLAYGASSANSTFDGEITNVTVGSMSNSSNCLTPAPGPGSIPNRYSNFTTSVAAPNFVVGETIDLSVTMGTCNGNYTSAVVIFIDWNQDGDFDDAGERVYESPDPQVTPTIALTGTFDVPVDATPGTTRMRVIMWETFDVSVVTPTGTYGWGETEDYCVTVLDCTLPTVAVTVDEDCVNGTFNADVDVTNFGFGTSGTLEYRVNGGSTVTVPLASTGVETIGPFAATDLVELSVFHAFPICGSTDKVAYSTCPITLDCGTELNLYHCYGNGDNRTWHFINPDEGTISVEFFEGSHVLSGDGIKFYNGAPGVNQITVPTFDNDLNGIGFYTSTGDVFSMEVESDGSGSCADGSTSGPWTFRVLCTPSCTLGEADVIDIDTDCGDLEFSITLDYYFLGEIFDEVLGEFEPATEGGIRYIVNGGSPVDQTGLVEDIYTIGPFAIDASVQVYLLHETNSLCNKFLGTFTKDEVCPPANNTCATAQTITVQAAGDCMANATQGTTFDATTIIGAPGCGNAGGGPFLDAWYFFNSGFNPLPITVNVVAGTATHLGWEIYGPCGGAPIVCSTAPTAQVPALANNTNYRIRVFTNTALGTPGTFNVCVSGAAPALILHNTCGQNLAIPDNGCLSNLYAVGQFAISGAPAGVMGTDVALQSVELIANHTWNGDLRFYLVSPGGQQVSLILNRGGSADNIGNPALCPTATLVLQDGASPVSGLPTLNNVTGTYAPEEPLSTFNTGTANGNWLIRICDSAGSDVGALQFIKLNFVCLGVAATASNGGPYCTGETIQLNANTAEGTIFSWTGPNSFTSTAQNPTIANASLAASGTYTVTVTSGSNPCPRVVNTTVTVNPRPAAIATTGSYAICQNGTVPGGQGLTATAGPILTQASATYNVGDIPTTGDVSTVNSCNGVLTPLTVNIPPGSTVLGVNVTYQFNSPAAGGGWTSEQVSRIACVQTTLAETGPVGGYFACGSAGAGAVGFCGSGSGVVTYTRNGLTIANGVSATGVLTFNMQAYTTWPFGNPCGTTVGFIPNGTWSVTVNYLAPATVQWYDAPTGGNLVGTGSPFNPVAANAVDPAIPGMYTFYATYSDGTCEAPRTPAYFAVGDQTVLLEFYTDDFPSDLTWEFEDEATGAVLYSGSGIFLPPGATFQLPYCLPNNRCYKLRMTDSGNGSVGNGGYQLRAADQSRIIDNAGNFNFNGTSEITGNPYSFCTPMGTNQLIYTSCDKTWWRYNEYIVADPDVDVQNQYNVGFPTNTQDATSGYEFWLFNPNGGYSFRKFRRLNEGDGFAAGINNACHMRLRSAYAIPEFDLLNVRVRARVNGNNKAWGPACRFVRDEALALCPPTKLMDIPGNPYLSCNQFRQFNTSNNVHARPVSGANRYQFRFRIPAENVNIVVTGALGTGQYFRKLGWGIGVAEPLVNGKTYEVDVRASKDGGATWCTGGDPFTDLAPWGDVCLLTIGAPPAQEGGESLALGGDGELTLWPNPNKGEELWMSLSELPEGTETVTVDLHDMFGKRVSAQVLPTQGGHLYTVMSLPGDLAGGVYTVTITVGDMQYVRRLVVQP